MVPTPANVSYFMLFPPFSGGSHPFYGSCSRRRSQCGGTTGFFWGSSQQSGQCEPVVVSTYVPSRIRHILHCIAYANIQFVPLIHFVAACMYICITLEHCMHACDNPDLVTTFLQNGTTPLMVAAQEGRLSVVEVLVSVGAQVNSQDNVSNRTVCTTVPLKIKGLA